ncbi:MAG: DUF2231 domain-containing protein [Acidobacteria bacterium]|nr:DUF2231 domain-containing protein [Acidobacteriota bacterium]
MESRAKLFGHAIHPILIVFPLGLLATAVVFDIVALVRGNGVWSDRAYAMIAAGIIGGVVAAIFGFIDWMAIPKGTRAKSIGLWHAVVNDIALVLFAASWWLRRTHTPDPGTLALVCSFAGAAAALLGGWFGGELVERLGMAVDDGAHLDAPSSLSGRPASDNASRK